jgi:hypothetical protein
MALAAVLLGSCSRPPPPNVPTMRSPAAVQVTRWCNTLGADGQTRFLRAEDCADQDPRLLVSRAVVTNQGRDEIQVVNLDARLPGYIDFDPGIPGNNGPRTGRAPTTLAVGDRMPAVALVGVEREPGLWVVDVALGRTVAGPIPTVELPSPLTHVPGTHVFVYGQAMSRTLHWGRMDVACDGVLDTHGTDCTLEARWRPLGMVALDDAPVSVAADTGGDLYVLRRGRPDLLVLRTGLTDAGSACGDGCPQERWSAVAACRDGLDNDGDGLIDADDPQCFDPSEDNEAADPDGPACGDGLDNDGDGLIDADDPGCLASDWLSEEGVAGWDVCADGVDNDGDGRIDADDPDCALTGQEFPRAVPAAPSPATAPPACADGVDNDGDGLIDSDDPGCWAASGRSEAAPRAESLVSVLVTEGEDYVLVLDAVAGHVVIFDRARGERLRPNEQDPVRSALGIPFLGSRATSMTSYRFDVARQRLTDGSLLRVVDLVAHVSVTQGYADPLLLERTFLVEGPEGEVRERHVETRLQRTDLEPSVARVRQLTCEIPRLEVTRLGLTNLGCDDARLPRPQVVDPEALGDADPGRNYQLLPGSAFLGLLRYSTFRVSDDGGGIEPVSLPDDYRTREDVWTMTWEGVLPGTQRSDAWLSRTDPDWVEFLGTNPCSGGRNPCTLGLNLEACPDVQRLCQQGADLCSQDYPLCTLCPQACTVRQDLCALGVQPGDRLVFDRIIASSRDGACERFVDLAGSGGLPVPPAEYEIVTVQPDRVRVAPLVDAEAVGQSTTLPPRACFPGPAAVRIRAGGQWVWAGNNSGHEGAWRALGGQCVPRADAAARAGSRPTLGSRIETPQGFTLQVRPGTLAPLRDFQLRFDVRAGFFNTRQTQTFFLLGPSTRASAHGWSRQGIRVVFVDDAQNIVWVYDGSTYRPVGGPLP